MPGPLLLMAVQHTIARQLLVFLSCVWCILVDALQSCSCSMVLCPCRMQGYILLPEVGCDVPGNIFTHKVPGGVDVFSLVIDCDQVTVGRQ
jgi:hypothetical protein